MKTVLITGATSGIGMEFARRYAAKGYRLIITGRRTDRMEQLKEELEVPVERVAHRLKGDLGAELTKVASEQVVNKAT